MKTITLRSFTVGFLVLLPLLLPGCGGGTKVDKDTTAFEKAFSSAPAEVKAASAKAVAAFKAEKLLDAANALVETASKGSLAQEQKDALIDMVVKIQTIMSVTPEKSDMKVFQILENATARAERRPRAA